MNFENLNLFKYYKKLKIKFLILILTILIQIQLILSSKSEKFTSALILATCEVISELFIKSEIKFDIILYEESSKHLNDLIKGIFKTFEGQIDTELIHIKNSTHWNKILFQSALILVKNWKNLELFLKFTDLQNKLPKKMKFLVYVEDQNIKSIKILCGHSLPCFR